MKKILLPTVLLGASLFGCQNDSTDTPSEPTTLQAKDSSNSMVIDWSKFDLSGMDLSLDNFVLFEAKDQAEFEHNLPKALAALNTEIEELKKKDTRIDLVLYKLTFENYKATISDVKFIDSKNKTFITIGDNNALSIPPSKWAEIEELVKGKCPDGWIEGGTASSESGVAAITKQILAPNLDSTGDCVQIQYARGLLSVKICFKKC